MYLEGNRSLLCLMVIKRTLYCFLYLLFQPLKTLEISLTPISSTSQKLLASEPMVVDSTEDTPTKDRRPLKSEDVMMVDEETRMSADFRGKNHGSDWV